MFLRLRAFYLGFRLSEIMMGLTEFLQVPREVELSQVPEPAESRNNGTTDPLLMPFDGGCPECREDKVYEMNDD